MKHIIIYNISRDTSGERKTKGDNKNDEGAKHALRKQIHTSISWYKMYHIPDQQKLLLYRHLRKPHRITLYL